MPSVVCTYKIFKKTSEVLLFVLPYKIVDKVIQRSNCGFVVLTLFLAAQLMFYSFSTFSYKSWTRSFRYKTVASWLKLCFQQPIPVQDIAIVQTTIPIHNPQYADIQMQTVEQCRLVSMETCPPKHVGHWVTIIRSQLTADQHCKYK